MQKEKRGFTCAHCAFSTNKWTGKCHSCGAWDSMKEDECYSLNGASGKALEVASFGGKMEPETVRIRVPIKELEQALGGGIVQGATVLIGGDPGIGKSTMLLQLVLALGEKGVSCIYISGEESLRQVQLRASRLKVGNSNSVGLINSGSLEDILATMKSIPNLQVAIIDSIQTLYSEGISSPPGSVAQVRAATQSLISYAKEHNISIFFVGHVTKEGQIAGPKLLEHMVDAVLYFEGDTNSYHRILRSVKNRFGPVNEIGVFEMTQDGLKEVLNPSQAFLNETQMQTSGVSIFPSIEGSRPVMIEIQALVAPSSFPSARRAIVGWDYNRLSMILAVLAVRFGLNLASYDVYLSVIGGIKVVEAASDLAIAAAIVSAATNRVIPAGTAFFGEICLSGEVRKVMYGAKRIKEAARSGFKQVVCNHDEKTAGLMHIDNVKGLEKVFN
jgi:DNA repair protein RadA/Sms